MNKKVDTGGWSGILFTISDDPPRPFICITGQKLASPCRRYTKLARRALAVPSSGLSDQDDDQADGMVYDWCGWLFSGTGWA